jgi:hypothetical protein
LAFASPLAFAYEAIDTLPWPSFGIYPAYPREEGRPTDVWLQAGFLRDDNVLRTETGEQSDTILRYGGGIRHEARVVGRQRVRLDARGDYYDYRHFNDLDHFAYSVAGDWLWEIGNNWSGTVLIGQAKRQTDMGETQADRLDTAVTSRLAATAAYLVTPGFRLRGGLAGVHADRKTAAETETRAQTITAAADYVSPLANTLGLEYRYTNGNAPNLQFVEPLGAFVSNDYVEQEIAVVASYAAGTQLRFGGRLGYTRRDYDEFPDRNFDGWTGRLALDWLPGNKTILGFEAYREPRSIVDVSASHILVSGVAFGPRWAVTNQVVLSARFARERRLFDGDPSLTAGTTPRDEVATLVRFAVGWEPQRRWQLSLALDVGERESNEVGRDFQFHAVMGNLAWVW